MTYLYKPLLSLKLEKQQNIRNEATEVSRVRFLMCPAER